MAKPVLLNNIDHKDLRIITRHGSKLDDSHAYVQTFAGEFRLLQAHYPIIFRKQSEAHAYEPIALFGFETDENLFLEEDRWDAPTLPLLVERLPFMIGRDGEELMIHIDVDSPRISTSEGEPIFLPHGGMSPYLEHINSVLLTIHEGMGTNAAFIDALEQHDRLGGFEDARNQVARRQAADFADGFRRGQHGVHSCGRSARGSSTARRPGSRWRTASRPCAGCRARRRPARPGALR